MPARKQQAIVNNRGVQCYPNPISMKKKPAASSGDEQRGKKTAKGGSSGDGGAAAVSGRKASQARSSGDGGATAGSVKRMPLGAGSSGDGGAPAGPVERLSLGVGRPPSPNEVSDEDGSSSDPNPEEFVGASNAARKATVTMHQCSHCEWQSHNSNAFACCKVEVGYPMVRMDDQALQRAFSEVEDNKAVKLNHFQSTPVKYLCIHCCDRFHREAARNNGEREPPAYFKPNGEPSSWFQRYAQRSRNHWRPSPAVAKFLGKMHDDKNGKPLGTSLTVYKAMQNKTIKKATDWITELGGVHAFLWLFYGCAICMMYPLKACDWFRVQRNVRDDAEDCTMNGEDSGHWRCPVCFDRWTWGLHGRKRLVVIGEWDKRRGFYKDGYEFAFVGEIPQSLDNKIQFLKTLKILTILDGKEVNITKDTLLEVIDQCNAEVVKKFRKGKGMQEVREFTSATPTQEQLDSLNVHLFCEDMRLSMATGGHPFWAIDMNEYKKEIEDIDLDKFEYLLDASAACLAIEDAPVTGDSQKRIRRQIQWSEAFDKGRKVIKRKHPSAASA